jgi:hypothetical protein
MLDKCPNYDIINSLVESTDFLCQHSPKVCEIEHTVLSTNRRNGALLLEGVMYNRDYQKQYRRTLKGLTNRMYHSQRSSAKIRGHYAPIYTLKEFREWLFSRPNFNRLYQGWVDSGYSKMKVPSADRINNAKSYTLDNLRLVTFRENVVAGAVKQMGWSMYYPKCINCGTTKVKHNAKGLCMNCYSIELKKSKWETDRGRPMEIRIKISNGLKGKPKSAEHKLNLSKARRAYLERMAK